MFRDLKEYQDITKLYVDKVSKTENLEERRGSSIEQQAAAREAGAQRMKTLGNRIMTGNKEGIKRTPTNTGGRVKSEVKYNPGKPTPSSQIRKIDPAPFNKREKAAPVDKETPSPSSSSSSTPVKKMGRIETQNRARMGDARVDALKAKNAKFQAAKKSGNLAQFRKDNPKVSGADRAKQMAKDRLAKKAAMEEFTPYDIVLEYLLSTEQVATIEEANYVMTEMDGETIRSVVKEFMGGKPGDGYIGHPRLKIKNPLNPPKKETKKTTGKGSEKGVQGLGNRATEIEDMIKGM